MLTSFMTNHRRANAKTGEEGRVGEEDAEPGVLVVTIHIKEAEEEMIRC